MNTLIKNYVDVINTIPDGKAAELLESVYANDIVFKDPIHEIHGLDKLSAYFIKLYQNTNDCQFEVSNALSETDKHALQWTMRLSHKSLRKGKTILVNGSSFLMSNDEGKIIRHTDYFDLGEMLYENIPVISSAVNFIKAKL